MPATPGYSCQHRGHWRDRGHPAARHEKLDSSGYPEGLKGEEITEYGRMVAITDVYDAITSDRVCKGMTPTQGLKKLLEWSGDHLDPTLVKQFIRCIGLCGRFTGTAGRAAGRGGNNDADQRLPVVRVMYHTARLPITVETIDLSQPGNQDRIVRAVNRKTTSSISSYSLKL